MDSTRLQEEGTDAVTRSPLWRIVIAPRSPELDAHAHAVLKDIHELGLTHVRDVSSRRVFLIESDLAESQVQRIADELLGDSVTESVSFLRGDSGDATSSPVESAKVEVHLKGGVMDPVAASTVAAIADMGIDARTIRVSTARLYELDGVKSRDELDLISRRLLFNDCIEDVYLSGFGRDDTVPKHLPQAPTRAFELRHVKLRDLDAAALARLSRETHLFLSVAEMQAIQNHYRDLGREPTDLELEMFAQTWSEHCVHKTLKSAVRYVGAPLPAGASAEQRSLGGGQVEIRYDNLLRDTIARATRELIDSGRVDWCWSVFEDNAGVIALDDECGLAFKVETHNHPSAIEPYGGAATGVGGCIRDVLGCGLGAKPIANTDVFCVGKPDFPLDLLPKGVLHPRRILKGVVAGVRDYGNRMGIPTVNGAVLFNDRYLGNPLVFCGCLGLIPKRCVHKEPQPGDLVVVIGGRTGRDGIHGATFSSAELTDTHADEFSHAVQIGNAITEKQVLDAMLQARDHERGCLYNATTDCGAGGLSSAVGEMGENLGAEVYLEKVPLKYTGLRYDEIWISEAQERMVFSVPPENWEAFRAICKAENVEATVIGEFRNDGRLIIRYDGRIVGEIDAHFLHHGVPQAERNAIWTTPKRSGHDANRGRPIADPKRALLDRLSSLDACSKEWIIRQYDHEVQGASVIKPLVGPGAGPSDAAVLRPRLDRDQGVALSNGICPITREGIDPYWMAVAAIDEAIRNAVCVGGNPDRTAILDNFCWGNCEDPQVMGALVRTCQGCYDAAVAYGTPFISGKDSLNNEFALDAEDARRLVDRMQLVNNRIRIPETLLISAISIIDDVNRCVTMDAKPHDGQATQFYLVGFDAKDWCDIGIEPAAALHHAVAALIRTGKVLAAHDVGSYGILAALAEMAFAGECGIEAEFSNLDPFAPILSGYVLQMDESKLDAARQIASRVPSASVHRLGMSNHSGMLVCRTPLSAEFEATLADLAQAWRSGLNW